VAPDPDLDPPSDFDAIAAAEELDAALAAPGSGSGPGGDALLEGELDELQRQLARKDAELQRAHQRATQAHAEVEAIERRLAAASAKELERRTRALIASFLHVVDDLDRAITAARTADHPADVVTGIELVRRELLARFGQLGVAHAPALGERFDPERHEAMAVVPVIDPAQDGVVVAVMREGYSIGDDTLRPAGVAVGKRAG
jgi:molecular chaperone GrpE